jgi:hypothetical protein
MPGIADEDESGGGKGDVCDGGKGVCARAEEDAAKIRAFHEWLDANHLPVNLLKVESMPVFRMGTTATQELREKQLYVAVPEHMLIGPERVGPGSKLQNKLDAIANKHGDLSHLRIDNRIKLIMFLLREARDSRKKLSFWKPYIDLLPVNLSNPFLWPQEDIEYLQASEVAEAAIQEQRKLRVEYDQLRSHVFSHNRKVCPIFPCSLCLSQMCTSMPCISFA